MVRSDNQQTFQRQLNPALFDGSHQVYTDSLQENFVINADSSYVLSKLLEEWSIDMIYTAPAPMGYLADAVHIETIKRRFVGTQTNMHEYLERLLGIMGGPCYRVLKPEGHIWIDLPDIYDEEKGSYLGIPETFFISMIYGHEEQHLVYFAADKPIWHRSYDPTVAMPILKKRMKRDWENVHHFTKARHEDCYWKEDKKGWYGKTSVLSAPLDYEKEESPLIESGYPEKLIEAAIELSCPPGGTVLDPFGGTGTTAKVAKRMGRRFILCDLAYRVARDSAYRFGLTEVKK